MSSDTSLVHDASFDSGESLPTDRWLSSVILGGKESWIDIPAYRVSLLDNWVDVPSYCNDATTGRKIEQPWVDIPRYITER